MSLLRQGKAQALTMYLGESDQWQGMPLYVALVQYLRSQGCAGATATRAVAGYGAGSRLHESGGLRWSSDVLLSTKHLWLLALLYLVASILGGVLAVWFGDWLGQLGLRTRRHFVQQAKATARRRSQGLTAIFPDGAANESHVDIQDDVLLPDHINEEEIRQ